VRALVMAAESWTLARPDGATDREYAEAVEFIHRSERGIPDHPWAAEIKAVFAVDADGWTYFATRRRNDGEGDERAVPPESDDFGGRIPVGLRALLLAIRGERS